MTCLVALALLLSEGGPGQPTTAPRPALLHKLPAAMKRLPSKHRPRPVLRPAGPRLGPQPSPPPRTPEGLPPCTRALRPGADLHRAEGETIRYLVEVDGLSVGTVDFKIERRGTYEGLPVTEYRSLFKLDGLVSAFLPVDGRAAALVPEGGFWPRTAMSRYRLAESHFEENVTYTGDGSQIVARRSKNGKESSVKRTFGGPAPDFVSAFYLLRSLPPESEGCALLYGHQRAYTIWLKPDGQEQIKTPVGMRLANRYQVRYGSERSRAPLDAVVWIGADAARLPYRAELSGKHRLEARIHLYGTGR